MSARLAATALAAALSIATADAQAQQPCEDHSRLAERLSTRWSETPVAAGLLNSGLLVQVFASRDGATWTIVTVRPDGRTCVVAVGEGWRALEEPAEDGET